MFLNPTLLGCEFISPSHSSDALSATDVVSLGFIDSRLALITHLDSCHDVVGHLRNRTLVTMTS